MSVDRYRKLLIALLKEEIKLLEETDLSIDEHFRKWPHFFPRDRHILQVAIEEIRLLSNKVDNLVNKKSCCALSEESDQRQGVLKLITGIETRVKKERKYLFRQIHGARKLIITDPYFFQWSGPNKVFQKESQYSNFLLELLPNTITELKIYHLPGPNSRIKHKFHKMVRSRQIDVKYIETNKIHDRVFVKNDLHAFLVGTSLGGYSNKLAFVLPIPDEDLTIFLEELERIKDG